MNPIHDVSSIDGDTSIQHRSMMSVLGGGSGSASAAQPQQQHQDLDAISIRGDLWFIADGNKPNKANAAGRGTKQHIVIENGRLEIFSSSSDQARMVKGFTMRNIRRTSWFVHDTSSSSSSTADSKASSQQSSLPSVQSGGALQRGRGKAVIASAVGRTQSAGSKQLQQSIAAPSKYFYMIVEAAVDALHVPHHHSAVGGPRNDRLVFCTDHQQDFQLWMQFFDQLGPGITLEDYYDGRSVSVMSAADSLQSRSATPPPGGAAATFDENSNNEKYAASHHFKNEVEKLSSFAAEWKMKAMDLFHSVQSTIAEWSDNNHHHNTAGGSTAAVSSRLSVGELNDDWHTHSTNLVNQLRRSLLSLDDAPPPLSLQDTRAFRSGSVQSNQHHHHALVAPPAAAAPSSLFDSEGALEHKIRHLEKLVHHYIRTETSACDVINDFERRNRALMGAPLSGDTPSKLRAVYSHLSRKLSAAWVTISSQPRSTSSGGASVSPFVSRSHSAETNTTAQHRIAAKGAAMLFNSEDSFALVPPTPESYAAAANALSISVEELINLVLFVRAQVTKAEEAGHIIVSRDAHPLPQQLDVIMQQLSSVDAATVRVETERVLATRTEYLLSEIARLRSILDEKERRLAETQVRASRLEEFVATTTNATSPHRGGSRFGGGHGSSSSPVRGGVVNPVDALANASLRDTERTIGELLKTLEHHGVQLPNGHSNAVKLRFAFENLLFNTTPLIHQLISPEEAHGLKQLIDHKSHTIHRLERQLQDAQAIQDQIHRQHQKEMNAAAAAAHHYPDGRGIDKPSVTLHAITSVGDGTIAAAAVDPATAAAAARKVADLALMLRQREEQIDIMKQELQSVKDIEAIGTANKAELDHWKGRCAKLERDAALAHISADAVLSAATPAATTHLVDALPSPVLSVASSQAAQHHRSIPTSSHQQPNPSEERFVQLLTMKNRQIASLQTHITTLLAAQPIPSDAAAINNPLPAVISSLQLPPPSSDVVMAGGAPRSSSIGSLVALNAYQDTEQAALGLLEEAEADFGILLPEGSTAARLRYVFDVLNRQLSEATLEHDGGAVSESTQRSNQPMNLNEEHSSASIHADALAQSVMQLSEAMGEPIQLPPRAPSEGSSASPLLHQQAVTKALGVVVQRATEFIKSGAFEEDDEDSPNDSARRGLASSPSGLQAEDTITSTGGGSDRAPLAATSDAPRRASLGTPRRIAAKAKPPSATSSSSPLQAPLSVTKVLDSTKLALELDTTAQQLRGLVQKHTSHESQHAASLVSHTASIHESIHDLDALIKRLEKTAHDERHKVQALKSTATQQQQQHQDEISQLRAQLQQQRQQQLSSAAASPIQKSVQLEPLAAAVDQRELSALENSAIDAITDMLANENLLSDPAADEAAPPQQLRDGVLRLLKQSDDLKEELRRAHVAENDLRRDLVVARSEISRQALLVTEAESQRDEHISKLRASQRLLSRFFDDIAEEVASQKKSLAAQFVEFHRFVAFMHHEGIRDALAGALASSRRSMAATQSLDGRVAELEQHIATVSKELQQSQTTARDLRATIEEERSASEELRSKNAALTAELREVAQDTDAQLAELERKLETHIELEAQLRKENVRLDAQIDNLTESLRDQEEATDRTVESTRKAQQSTQSIVDELTQELLNARQQRDRDVAAVKTASEIARRQWEQETEALRTRIDAMHDAATEGREDMTVLCLLGDPHEIPGTEASSASAAPQYSLFGGGLDAFEAFKDDEKGGGLMSSSMKLGASYGAATTTSLGSSTSTSHSFVKRRGSVAPVAAAASSPTVSSSDAPNNDEEQQLAAKSEDVLGIVQQLAGVKGGRDQRLTTSLARLKAFTNWCYDRLVPFAFGSNTQCLTVLDSIVWAVEGHMRLLRHSAPLLGAQLEMQQQQQEKSTSSSTTASVNMTISEKVAWRMRELSEEHDALRSALQSAAEVAATVSLTSPLTTVASPATSTNRRKSTVTIGPTSISSSSNTIASVKDNIATLTTTVSGVSRLLLSLDVPSLVDLELLVMKGIRSHNQHEQLLQTIRNIPAVVSSPLLGSDEDIVDPLRTVTAENASQVLVSAMQHVGGMLKEVEQSLALLRPQDDEPTTASSSPNSRATHNVTKHMALPVMSPEALRLSLAAIPHLQSELEQSRRDLRIALGSMADHHAAQLEDNEKGRVLLQGTVEDLRQRLQTEIDDRTAAESECRRQRNDIEILEGEIHQSNQQYEANSLRIQELELQLRRLDFDTVESLKVLGAMQGASVDGAELQRPSMISVATSAAERIRELEAVIQEAGWAIRPTVTHQRSGSLSSSMNHGMVTTAASMYGAPRRSFLAGASAGGGGSPHQNSPPQDRYVFPTESALTAPPALARQVTPQRSVSTVRASLLSPLVTVVSDDDDFTPDAHNSPSPSHAGGVVSSILSSSVLQAGSHNPAAQSLVQLCRTTAAENQQLRADRDLVSREWATLRTAVEDIAFHLRVQCDELRTTDNALFLAAATPKVVTAAQDTRNVCDAALQDAKHTTATLNSTSSKLAQSEDALRQQQDELAQAQNAAAEAERESQNRIRDLKKELEDSRRAIDELQDALNVLRNETSIDIASLQQKCVENQIARQALSDELGRVSESTTETSDILQASVRELTAQRDALQRKSDVLAREQQEALAFPSVVQQSIRSVVQLGQNFDQVTTLSDRSFVESAETSSRRQIELRWQQEQHSLVVQHALDSLRSVAMIVSIVGAPSTDSVADVVRALHQNEATLRHLCGDTSVGRKESVTRSDCITAIRQVLPLLHSSSSASHLQQQQHMLDESTNPPVASAPTTSIVQLLVDGCQQLSHEHESARNDLVNATAEVKSLKDELRRLRAGADDAEEQQTHTQYELTFVQLQNSEQHQRRQLEMRFIDAHLSTISTFASVAVHQAAAASSLLPQPCAVDQIVASVEALLHSEGSARALLGSANSIAANPRLKADTSTRIELLSAMNEAVVTLSEGRHANSSLMIPIDESVPISEILLEFAVIMRDDGEETHEALIATTRALEKTQAELRDAENRAASTGVNFDEAAFAHAAAILALEELHGRRVLEQRHFESLPIREHLILAANASVMACSVSGEPTLSVGGLPSFVQDTVANAAGYLSLVGDPTAARRDLSTRSSLIAAAREAIQLLQGTDSELDVCSALVVATRTAAYELRDAQGHLQVLVPEAHKAQEDVKYLTASLKSVQSNYDNHGQLWDQSALSLQETVERQSIEGRYWESLDLAPMRLAATIGWQAASFVGAPLHETPQELRQLVASEMRLRALAGDMQLTRDTPTEVTRSSCIAAIMQAIHVLGADVKGDLLSSLLSACASAARTVDDAHAAIPALTSELRKLKEDHRALQQQHAALQEDSTYVKTRRDQLLLQHHELQGRRHLELQAQGNAWETLVPVATMAMSHALEATSVFGDRAPVTSLLAQSVHSLARERAYLATLAGDTTVLPTDGSRSELIEAIVECLGVLEYDIPRQHLASTLISACRSSHRQTEGDAIALQTITSELKRTQEELSVYAVQTLSAKEHSHSTSSIVLLKQLCIDELTERLQVQMQWAHEAPQPHMRELVEAHHAATLSASALGVSLPGLVREVHRIADEHVIFSGMVGELDVGAHMGSRSELAQTVLRAIDILRTAVGVSSSRTHRKHASPSREDGAALISIAHDIADALALSRARARAAEGHLVLIAEDAQVLVDGIAQSCMTLREDKRKQQQQLGESTYATPPRPAAKRGNISETPYSALRALVGVDEDYLYASPAPAQDIALNQSFGSAGALDRSVEGAVVDETRVAHLHRRLHHAGEDLDRAARDASTRANGLSAILQSACEVLRRSRGGGSAANQQQHTSEAFDVLELATLCKQITEELDAVRDDHVCVSCDFAEAKGKAAGYLGALSAAVTQIRETLLSIGALDAEETRFSSHSLLDNQQQMDHPSIVAKLVDDAVKFCCKNLKASHEEILSVKSIVGTAMILHSQNQQPPPIAVHHNDAAVRHVEALVRSFDVAVKLLEQEKRSTSDLRERLHDADVAAEANRELLEGQADSLNSDLIRKMEEVQVLLRRLEASNHRVSQLEGCVVEIAHACRLSTTLAPPLLRHTNDTDNNDDATTTDESIMSHTDDDALNLSAGGDAVECARRAADAASSALRSNDVLLSEQRSLKHQLAHSAERCAHAEREVALMHERLDQSSAQFTALQQEDALRARELRTMSDNLSQAKEDTRRMERDLLEQQEHRVADMQRRLDDLHHSSAAAQAQLSAAVKGHEEEITALKEEISSLQRHVEDLQQSGNGQNAQLRRVFARMRTDSVDGCLQFVDDLALKYQLVDLQLEEATRRQRTILSASVTVPSPFLSSLISTLSSTSRAATLLHARDHTEVSLKIQSLMDSNDELLQLAGDTTVGRSSSTLSPSTSSVISRSEAIIAILHALTLLHDDSAAAGGDDVESSSPRMSPSRSGRRGSFTVDVNSITSSGSAMKSITEQLINSATTNVESLARARRATIQGRSETLDVADRLSSTVNVIVASLSSLRRAVDPVNSNGAATSIPAAGGSVVQLVASLDVAVRDACDHIEQMRDTLSSAAASLACLRLAGGETGMNTASRRRSSPPRVSITGLSDVTSVAPAVRSCVDELLALRQQKRDLELKLERTNADRGALLKSVVSSLATLPRLSTIHRTTSVVGGAAPLREKKVPEASVSAPSSANSSIVAADDEVNGFGRFDVSVSQNNYNDDTSVDQDATAGSGSVEPISAARQLEACTSSIQAASRSAAKVAAEAVSILREHVDHEQFIAVDAACQAGTERRPLLVALVETTAELYRNLREEMQQQSAVLRRAENRAEQLRSEVAANEERHLSQLQEQEEERTGEAHRFSGALEKAKDAAATQRARADQYERVLHNVSAALSIVDDVDEIASKAAEIRTSLDSLRLQHKSLSLAHSNLTETSNTRDTEFADTREALKQLQDDSQLYRKTTIAELQQERAARSEAEGLLALERDETAVLTSKLSNLEEELRKVQHEHQDQISRVHEVQQAEIELLHSQVRDRDEHLLHLDAHAQETTRELRILQFRHDSHLSLMQAESLEEVAQGAREQRHTAELLEVELQCANEREKLLQRSATEVATACAGWVTSTAAALARAATLLGPDVAVESVVPTLSTLLQHQRELLALLGADSASSVLKISNNGIAVPRTLLLEAVLASIRELSEAVAADDIEAPNADSTLPLGHRRDVHVWLEEVAQACARDLVETRATLEARSEDLRKLYDEHHNMSFAIRGALHDIKHSKTFIPNNVHSIFLGPSGTSRQGSPEKHLPQPQTSMSVADDSVVLSLASTDAAAVTWRELPGEARELADASAHAHQTLVQAATLIVPVALPHLRGGAAAASTSMVHNDGNSHSVDNLPSQVLLVDNVVLACHRAAVELMALREEKVAARQENEQLRQLVEGYLGAVRPTVRSIFQTSPPQQNGVGGGNDSFLVALPDAGITSTDTIDLGAVSAAEHAALWEELKESTQRMIADVKKHRRWARESLDLLNPVVHHSQEMIEGEESSSSPKEMLLPETSSLAAEIIVQLRSDGEGLRTALRKTESKLDNLKSELRGATDTSESQAAQHEIQILDMENAHKEAAEKYKANIADLQREVALLKRTISDVIHTIDLDDTWDAPVELFQRIQTRLDTILKQFEQAQQTVKHQTSEIKQLKVKEGDLTANRIILESQLDQVTAELEETQRLNTTRAREHRKELELLQKSVEELQHSLNREKDENEVKSAVIERQHAEHARQREVHDDELQRMEREAQEAEVLAKEALTISSDARAAVTKQLEVLTQRVNAHNRHVHVDSLDGADAAWAAATFRISQLELLLDEAVQRHNIEAKCTQRLLVGTEGIVGPVLEPFLYRGHSLAVSSAVALGADFSTTGTMLRTLVDTEQRLQHLQGDPHAARKTNATRSDLVDAVTSIRMYLGLPFEFELDHVFASGAAAAVADLLDRYNALSAQHSMTTSALSSASDALQRLTDSAASASIILQGPLAGAAQLSASDSLFALSPISPVGGQPTSMKVTALSAQLERAAQISADAVRRHKHGVIAVVNGLSVLWDPVNHSNVNTSTDSASSMLVTPPRMQQHRVTSSVFGGSDPLESLEIAADRLSREIATLRTTNKLLEHERDELAEKLTVYHTRVPSTLKTLSAAIATITGVVPSSTSTTPIVTPQPSPSASPARGPAAARLVSGGSASLNTSTDAATVVGPAAALVESPSAVCIKLQNQALQVVEEWSRAHKQLQDTIHHLQSIPSVAGRSAVLAAASAVDAAREQETKLEQRALQTRKLEARIESLQHDIQRLQDQHELSTTQHASTAQATEAQLLHNADKLRGQLADASAIGQILRTFVNDISSCLHEDIPQSLLNASSSSSHGGDHNALLSNALHALVKSCTNLRHNYEASQQQNRRLGSTIENMELELNQGRVEIRELKERADTLVAHLQELQREREASDKKYRFEIEQHVRSFEDFERKYASSERDAEVVISDLKKQIDEAISGIRRVSESCGIVGVSPSGRPIPVAELVHLAQRHIEMTTRDLAEALKLHKDLESEHRKSVAEARAETSRLLQSLDRVSFECDARREKEGALIKDLEALVSEYHELLAPARVNDAPMTPVAIVAMCLEQAEKRNKLLDIAKRTQQQLEVEAAKAASQAGNLREELRKAQAERQELSTQYTALQKSFHAVGVEGTTVNTELNGLKHQIHKLFASACALAQRDLGMTIQVGEPSTNSNNVSVASSNTTITTVKDGAVAPVAERAAVGELTVILSILQNIAHRYRNAPTSDELHTIKSEHTNALAEERNKRSALERLQAKLEETLLPLLLPHAIRSGHASRSDDDSSATSNLVTASTTPRALIDDVVSSAVKVKDNLMMCAAMLQDRLEIDISADGMKHSDLGTISSLLLDATHTVAQRYTRMVQVANSVADTLHTPRINDTANATVSVSEATRRWAERVLEAARRGQEDVHGYSDKLVDLLKQFSTQSAISLPPALTHADSAAARDGQGVDRRDAALRGVQEFLRSLVQQLTHLTSEWQSQGDVNRRQALRVQDLIAERDHFHQQLELQIAEQQKIEPHIVELRRQVRKKLEDDRRSEEQMQLLDQHLDQQAAEFALKYRSDRDFIERRFADLRGVIFHAMHPRAPSVSSIGGESEPGRGGGGIVPSHHHHQQSLASMTTFSRVSSRSNSGAY